MFFQSGLLGYTVQTFDFKNPEPPRHVVVLPSPSNLTPIKL